MNDPGLTIVPPGPGWGSFWLTMGLLALMLFGFVSQAGRVINKISPAPVKEKAFTGVPMSPDEKYRINLALRAHALQQADPELGVTDNFNRWLPHYTDGETGPFWPWAVSRLVAEEHPFQESAEMAEDYGLLRRGKWMHVWMAAFFLSLAGFLAAGYLSPPAVMLMLLPAAFMTLLPASVMFRQDLLYYLLFFLCWLCALRLLRKNSVWLHGAFGVLTGVAWLTETNTWILMAAWFIAASLRWLGEILRRGEARVEETWTSRNHFVGLVAMAIGWLAVCGPRCGAAMDRWGKPFFSYQQQWMWLDTTDRGALLKWARAHPGKQELSEIPESERPSFANYQRTHSPEQMQERLVNGWSRVWRSLTVPLQDGTAPRWQGVLTMPGVYPLGGIVILAGACIVALSRRKKVDREGLELPDGVWSGAFFTAVATAGYGAWHGWMAPPVIGEPVWLHAGIAVLFLPLMFTLVRGAEGLMTLARMRGAPRWTWQIYQILMWLLVAGAAAWIIPSVMAAGE